MILSLTMLIHGCGDDTGNTVGGIGGSGAGGMGAGGAGAGGAQAGTGGTMGVGGEPGSGGVLGTGGELTGTGGSDSVGAGGDADAGTDAGAGPDGDLDTATAGTGGEVGTGGAPGTGGAVNVIADPSVEGAPPGPWSRINSCGTYAQSTAFVHSGAYSGATTGRTQTGCGVANGSLPLIDGTYAISLYALFDAGNTGLTSLPFRVTARVDCDGAAGPKYVTIANAVTAPPATWTSIFRYLTVQTTAPAADGVLGCKNAGETLTKIYIYLEQASGTVYPDLYMDDLDVH